MLQHFYKSDNFLSVLVIQFFTETKIKNKTLKCTCVFDTRDIKTGWAPTIYHYVFVISLNSNQHNQQKVYATSQLPKAIKKKLSNATRFIFKKEFAS